MPSICASVRHAASREAASSLAIAHRSWGERPAAAALPSDNMTTVPDHSSIWRFREELARRGLAERLLAEVNRQLDAKGLILRRGTLINATILEAAVRRPGGDAGEVSPRDPQAGWTRKNGESRFGYEAHVAVDEGSGIVRAATLTPADVHDSVPADDPVQGDEEAVYADRAYDSETR